jgi:hypothetical protein
MEVDDGNTGAGLSGERNDEESNDSKASQGRKEKMNKSNVSSQHSNSSRNGNPVDELLGAAKFYVVHGTVIHSNLSNTESQTGNSPLNFSQEIHDANYAAHITNEPYYMPSSPADLGSQQTFTLVTPQKITKDEGNKGKEGTLEELEILATRPIKRSKRRENSVDEDSSARGERLETKKHYYNTPLYQQSITLCNNGQLAHRCYPVSTMCPSSDEQALPIGNMGHVAHA